MKSNKYIYRIAAALTAVLAVAAALSLPNFAQQRHTPTTTYGWYFKKNTDGSQPTLPSEFDFITKNGGYYLDTKVKSDDKVIYLTFDAGYENGNVATVLDALEKHKATGAFFILDNLIIRDGDLVKRMLDGGNIVANHTSRHPDMSAITDRTLFDKQIKALEKLFLDTYGTPIAPYYRPPQGRFSELNMKYASDLGYKTIFWSYAYADWDNDHQPNPRESIEKIMAHTHNGEVILLHPTSATNAAIMDELLTRWEAAGYRFGSLDELTR